MLTDIAIRKAKAEAKPRKLFDAGGLFLLVSTTGAKSWRLKYRYAGKEKLLALGMYPTVSLSDARDRRDDAKRELAAGQDPSIEKKKRTASIRSASSNSFEAVGLAWYDLNEPRWSASHKITVKRSLERDVFPELGHLPIRDVTEALLLDVLKRVEARGAIETAKRIRQRTSEIFAYAAAAGMRTGDPAAVIKTLMKPTPKRGKQPALVKLDEVRQLLRDVEATEANPITKLAHRIIALTAVRSSAQCNATWPQLEHLAGAEPLWRIPPTTMKLKVDRKEDEMFEHLVPLSTQAVEAFEALKPLTGHLHYIFPNERHARRPMSNNAVRSLIIRAKAGIYLHRHCPHGWRSSFSTIMNEWRRVHGRADDREVIDLMLAHIATDKVEGAYNRAAHMERRRELAQIWADMLMEGMPPASSLLRRVS